MKIFRYLLFALLVAPAWAVTPVYVSYQNWCMVGGQTVSTQGLASTNFVQASFKSCTVTVHIHGGGLATLFSNKTGTPLSNPFTAQSNGLYQFFIDSTVANEFDITTSAGTPPFPSPVTLADVFIFAPGGGGGGGGTVQNCATTGSIAFYAVSGIVVTCIGADLTFSTHTLTGGASLITDLSASSSLKVPVAAGATAGFAGVIAYDSTNKSTHFQTNNADSIAATFASAPAGSKCLHTNGVTGLITETSGDCSNASGTVNTGTATHLAYYATSTNAVSDMGADFVFSTHTISTTATAILDLSAASLFKVPVSAGAISSADGVVAYDTTAKSFHFRINAADAIGAGFASAPAGSKCLHTNGVTGLITEASADCNSTAGSVAFSGITSGTNTTAAMVVGAGASLDFTSTGTINANKINGTLFAGTSGHLVSFGASNIPADSGVAATTVTNLQTHYCEQVIGGSGAAFALTAGDDAVVNNTCFNDTGITWTVTAMKCRSDAGSNTTTINPTFGADGTGTSLCSGALTCGSSYAFSSSCSVSNATVASGKGFRPVMSGTLTGTSIVVEYIYTTP